MSRKVKNIIMITIIIIVCIASGFTIKLAKESGEGTNQGNPPQMLNSSGENNSNGQMGTPPNGMGGNTQIQNNSSGNNQGTPPSKPDGKNNSNSQENENMPSMPDMQNGENNIEIETSYYIIFGIEAFVVSILVIYLIMSGFNSKTLAETLNGAKKIIIYIILVAIVTTGLTFAQSYITKYTTTGNGSPSIYSTADITVNDATLVAKASEGIVIEGANTVTINNCDLTDSNTKLNGQSTTYKNIFLYQSMSGDASNGNATFTAKNSKIITNNGDTFYITNTTATINLTNNTIVNNDSTGNFLRAQKDSWGNTGSNGGNVTLIMTQHIVILILMNINYM